MFQIWKIFKRVHIPLVKIYNNARKSSPNESSPKSSLSVIYDDISNIIMCIRDQNLKFKCKEIYFDAYLVEDCYNFLVELNSLIIFIMMNDSSLFGVEIFIAEFENIRPFIEKLKLKTNNFSVDLKISDDQNFIELLRESWKISYLRINNDRRNSSNYEIIKAKS